MLVDMHTHTGGISTCSVVPYDKLVEHYAQNGYGGIVLTNHYKADYIRGSTFDEWIKRYVDEFYLTAQAGRTVGINVFFGIEVKPINEKNIEYLIYGAEPEFVKKNKELYNLTQKELFKLCHENNLLLFQAHPYRNGATPQNPKYLDGYEINCHPLYGSNERTRVSTLVREAGLILSCGSDYHGDTYFSKCGMILPDDCRTSRDLVRALTSKNQPDVVIHEIAAGVWKTIQR